MPRKRIFVDNPDPAGPEIDPETNTIDVGGGMFGSREYIPPPPYGQDKGDDRYQHLSLQRPARGGSAWFDRLNLDPAIVSKAGLKPENDPPNELYRYETPRNSVEAMPNFGRSEHGDPQNPYNQQSRLSQTKYKHPSLQASRGGTFNPSMSQFSSEWFPQGQQQKAPYVPGQTPTAEQEALQEPAIDPVVLAAGGVAGGLENVMNKPMGNMSGKIVSRGMGSLRYEMEPSLSRMIQNFGKGAWNTGKSGALVQAINNYLMPQHSEAGKAASLPVGSKLVDKTDRMLGIANREQYGSSIVDKFGKPIFDESGKMIPWLEAEKAPSKAASKINWTNVGDMLKKLIGDIGEVE